MKLCSLCLLVALLVPSFATAGTFKIVKAGATPLSELSLQPKYALGTVDTVTPKKGTVFLLVEMEILPVYGNGEDSVDSHYETFGVYDGSQKLPVLFGFGDLVVDNIGNILGFYKGGEDKVESKLHRMVVIAPVGKTSFTLRIAPQTWDEKESENKPGKPIEAPLKIEGQPKPFSYADYVSVQVLSMKFVDSVKRVDYSNNLEFISSNPGGSILAVRIKFTPKPSFLSPKGMITFDSSNVGLTFGKGGSCACMGHSYDGAGPGEGIFGGTLEFGVKDKYQDDSDKQLTLYFPIPSNLRAANVTFGGQKLLSFEIPAKP